MMQPMSKSPASRPSRIPRDQRVVGGRRPVTIKSLMVITMVFASSAASAGYLWRAANGDTEEVGRFVIVTAMSPLLLTVAVFWAVRVAGRRKK